MNNEKYLVWTCISYEPGYEHSEETICNGVTMSIVAQLISCKTVEEADYMGGKLVKSTYRDYDNNLHSESMCFVPNEKVSRETYNESPLKNYIKTLEKSLDLDKKVGNLQGLKEILI